MDQNQHQQLGLPLASSAPSPVQLDLDQPQDVLSEARKNLQVLIDSGFSRDLLHQWVDDSQSLHLSPPGIFDPSQPLVSEHEPPPPAPSRCAPASSPSQNPSVIQGSTPVVAVSAPPPVPSIAIKPETLPDDATRGWPPSILPSSNSSPEQPNAAFNDAESSVFMAPPAPFPNSHRPRISISSVSSGSSGRASIWSTNSA